MGRPGWLVASLLACVCASSTASASKKVFSVQDDLLAFPQDRAVQFQVFFPDDYILDSQVDELVHAPSASPSAAVRDDGADQKHAQVHLSQNNHNTKGDAPAESHPGFSYEEMILSDSRYLCQIPQVDSDDRPRNETKESSETEVQRELQRATDRGMELLREMEGKCMYYVSGWWSYAFCYQKQIKQFHALPSGSGIPNYPPMEDPTAHSFILGRFPRGEDDDSESERQRKKAATTTDMAQLQTRGGSRYLVQRLDGGTRCDLTGKRRRIEVQFHCHPQSTDRIGWIKEVTTCSYLMVVYTPRLCNDVAFLPPQQEEVHPVECRQILSADQVPEWEARKRYQQSQRLVGSEAPSEFPVVGDIAVGAKRLVGMEGKQIEKGRVASIGEEKVEVVAKCENGEIQQLSREKLKKYDLDPEKIETLKKRLEELAQGKDWTLEMVSVNGERGLRGIVDADDEEEEEEEEGEIEGEGYEEGEEEGGQEEVEPAKEAEAPEGEGEEEGSEERYKDEL